MKLRQFRPTGIEVFRNWLAECRENPRNAAPRELLENYELTELISPAINVKSRSFRTRREAARFLNELLEPLAVQEVESNSGLWLAYTIFLR
jgi:hypothetical protein